MKHLFIFMFFIFSFTSLYSMDLKEANLKAGADTAVVRQIMEELPWEKFEPNGEFLQLIHDTTNSVREYHTLKVSDIREIRLHLESGDKSGVYIFTDRVQFTQKGVIKTDAEAMYKRIMTHCTRYSK